MDAATKQRRGLRIPIRIKILVILLVVITAVVSVITFTMANLFHTDKKAYIHDLTSLMALHTAEETDSLLRSYNERLQVFGRVMYDPLLKQQEKAKLLQGLFEDFPEFIAVSLYQHGTELATVYDSKSLGRAQISKQALLQPRAELPALLDAIAAGALFVANTSSVAALPNFTMVTPINSGKDRGGDIVVVAVIRLDNILGIADRSSIFDIYLLDNANHVTSHSDSELILKRAGADWLPAATQQQLEPLMSRRTRGTTLEFLIGDTEMVGGYASVDLTGMILGVQIPKSAAYLTARELLNNLTGVSLLLLLVSALLSLFWSRQITRPVEKLTAAARDVGQGNFHIKLDMHSGDEMGELAQSFNHMAGELDAREQALEQAQAALVQSEKMSAFGQLSAGIAHEVKNPLAGILGYAQLSMRKADKESPIYRHLSLIEKETKRCKNIIDNLMKFARQEKLAMEPTDLNQVVEEAMAIVDHQLTLNRVKLEKVLTPDLPLIEGNGNQIQQVLMNFMINAQQALNGEPGTVTVSTCAVGEQHVEVRVTDTGPGIPKDIQAKIFEPFFTTKAVGKGTGLGLSVTFGIIRDQIRLESEPGQGASFIVSFPIPATPGISTVPEPVPEPVPENTLKPST